MSGLAGRLAEPGRPFPLGLHPEAALEVDLAGREPALDEERDRLLGALAAGNPRRSEADRAHGAERIGTGATFGSIRRTTVRISALRSGARGALAGVPRGAASSRRCARGYAVRPPSYRFFCMSKRPTRIELLELDIDVRLADLWAEAAEVTEWSLEVVAAFMRAAYGKGYCDALTEDDPGQPVPRSRLPHPAAPPDAHPRVAALPRRARG